MPSGVAIHAHGSADEPANVHLYPTLLYERLSETTDVYFTEYGPARGVRAALPGKALGRDGADESTASVDARCTWLE